MRRFTTLYLAVFTLLIAVVLTGCAQQEKTASLRSKKLVKLVLP